MEFSKRGDLDGLAGSPAEDLLVTDDRGSYPLHWAAGSGHLACVQHLIETRRQPVDLVEATVPGAKGRSGITGRTPLHFAARNGHIEVVRIPSHRSSPRWKLPVKA